MKGEELGDSRTKGSQKQGDYNKIIQLRDKGGGREASAGSRRRNNVIRGTDGRGKKRTLEALRLLREINGFRQTHL